MRTSLVVVVVALLAARVSGATQQADLVRALYDCRWRYCNDGREPHCPLVLGMPYIVTTATESRGLIGEIITPRVVQYPFLIAEWTSDVEQWSGRGGREQVRIDLRVAQFMRPTPAFYRAVMKGARDRVRRERRILWRVPAPARATRPEVWL